MREYGVTVCSEECGVARLDIGDRCEAPYWFVQLEGRLLVDFCPDCGTRVGIDEKGAWRAAMVPRAALEWLAEQCDDCPDLPGHECPVAHLDNEDMPEGACYKCWVDAALKAAGEAADE